MKKQRYTKDGNIFKLENTTIHQTSVKGFYRKSKYYELFKNGKLIIYKGYQWNGCSPKFKVFGRVYGTPDGKILPTGTPPGKPATWKGSLFHDCLYQIGVGSRKEADKTFYWIMKANGFVFAFLYFVSVRLFASYAWGQR